MRKKLLILIALTSVLGVVKAERIAHLAMDVSANGQIKESVNGKTIDVSGLHNTENIPGAVGNALRFDGYSTYAQGEIGRIGEDSPSVMTMSIWVAPETYPIVKLDEATEERVCLAGTIDESMRAGWSFSLGYTGKYSFECYTGGWKVAVEASDLMPCYEWSNLVAVVDGSNKIITLYRNGTKVGESRCLNIINNDASILTIGKSVESRFSELYNLTSFNGLIDDIEIFNNTITQDELLEKKPENTANLSIPESRFANDLLRPHFHGMPAAGWTNETHGMTYYNGRYHLFFQKNANGPYMTRLHWGHISSENLYDWREDKIALVPDKNYDIKGCWSGCVFTDDKLTSGKPSIIYTGVDYNRAVIAQASPIDENLIDWNKNSLNPIINGKPIGLSDDFRDPYFFRIGDEAYIIVGTSKNGIGAATLHHYNTVSKSWSNSGELFFAGKSVAQDGTFWEMPNVTDLKNGKWLFTVTPLGTSKGVHTLYWIGEISSDGKFNPLSVSPKDIELISKDGFGLLSPTIYQKDGKIIALGIVPDKLPSSENYYLGWAHTYSFPREWIIGENNELWQKPYEGLINLRSSVSYSENNIEISGIKSLSPVAGRRIELLGKFIVGKSTFGFSILKNSVGRSFISYNPLNNELVVDVTSLNRKINDQSIYDGVYRVILPERLAEGREMIFNVFMDGSIIDIFINNRWATSLRVFPNDEDSNGVEVFCENGSVQVNELNAWVLNYDKSGNVNSIINVNKNKDVVDVISIDGKIRSRNIELDNALDGLERGVYIVGDKKVFVK